jgi:predicted porin
MIGGLLKSASRVALVAAAGIMAGGVAAQAADLGGNCCADLEERVAELEATAARKGNRKVSLTVYGQVNEAVMFWDDGHESNAYVVSFNQSRTRFGFRGDARITADWSAGYLLEIGVRYANSGSRHQGTNAAGGDSNSLDIRHSAWYLDSKSLGRIWVGETASATDGITEINLSNAAVVAGQDPSSWVGGFFLRRPGFGGPTFGLTAKKWNDITPSFAGSWPAGEGDRNNIVRYVSPTIAGFSFSAAWGEDDMWDVALRYAGEFSGFRVAAGVGYKQQNDNGGKAGADWQVCADLTEPGIGGTTATSPTKSAVDCNAIGLSGSIMHVPSGLFVYGSWGRIDDKNRKALYVANVKDEDKHWYIQGGIEQKFFALGKTTIYGEYGNYETGAGLAAFGQRADFSADFGRTFLASSDVTVWGIGIVQNVEAAAMDLFLAYRNFSADLVVSNTGTTFSGSPASRAVEDMQIVMTGAIIRF